MSYFVFVFIGCTCMYAGAKILSSEERNKVFNRFPIQVEDVKKYNKFCAILVIGFGVVAELTMLCAYALGGLLSIVFTLFLIVEARIVMKIYEQGREENAEKR